MFNDFRSLRFLAGMCLVFILNCGGGSHGPSLPAPTISAFTATNTTLQAGGSTVLSYTFANGIGVITPGTIPVTSGGATNISPAATTTYVLTVTNSAGAVATQSVTVTVVPGSPSSITKVTGDIQTCPPSATLAVAPTISVVNANGIPLQGVAVAFVVLEGGGQVASPSAATDINGRASCGAWALGPSQGLNLLAARVNGLADLVFTASAAVASADVKISVLAPTSGQVVGETVNLAATVTSTYQLVAVTATIGSGTIPLVLGTYGRYGTQAWVGNLSFGTRARGPAGVTFTATDAIGNRTDLVVPVSLDRVPTVTVVLPADEALARPTVPLSVTAADDDSTGSVSLTATVNGTTVATGANTLASTLNLAAFEGQSVSLVVKGTDSIGQTTSVTRTVYVESSANLSLKATLPGRIWDVLGTRILFLDATGATPSLCIRDIALGTTEIVEASTDLKGTLGLYGYLTPVGAVYVRGAAVQVFPYSWLIEWRNGQLTNLGGLNSSTSLAVAGNYAIYNSAESETPIWRRDLLEGTSLQLAPAGNNSNGVAANGDVVFWATSGGYNIYRFRNGITSALTSDATDTAWNTYPLTDGTLTVYRRQDKVTGTCQVMMHDGVKATALGTSSPTQPNQGSGYAVAGGYVAYLVEDLAKKAQVWRRYSGSDTQITIFGTSSTIDLLAPNGTVFLSNQGPLPRRYRSVPGMSLQDIGSTQGRLVYRDGSTFVILGPHLMQVTP